MVTSLTHDAGQVSKGRSVLLVSSEQKQAMLPSLVLTAPDSLLQQRITWSKMSVVLLLRNAELVHTLKCINLLIIMSNLPVSLDEFS